MITFQFKAVRKLHVQNSSLISVCVDTHIPVLVLASLESWKCQSSYWLLSSRVSHLGVLASVLIFSWHRMAELLTRGLLVLSSRSKVGVVIRRSLIEWSVHKVCLGVVLQGKGEALHLVS